MAIDVSELEPWSGPTSAARPRRMPARSTSSPPPSPSSTADKRLAFYNAAFRALWQLDAGFLDDKPLDGEILDRLRVLSAGCPSRPISGPGS